jgi:glycosyltransferase involved in cell wall biosynthesis
MLNDLVTIVVPCKNEEDYIQHLLYGLSQQTGADGVRIIIADKSDDDTRSVIHHYGTQYNLNYDIVEGGPVSEAKNNGAKLVTTPYVLFIDADVRFFSDRVIFDTVTQLQNEDLDLIGLSIKCYDDDRVAKIGFSIFNVVNRIMSRWIPFAVGAYMLTRIDKFQEFGGFPSKYATSEDFFLSKMYDPKRFRIADHYFGQDSRRFKKMGYFGMTWYLIKNFINRNNEKHWKKIDSNKYWS